MADVVSVDFLISFVKKSNCRAIVVWIFFSSPGVHRDGSLRVLNVELIELTWRFLSGTFRLDNGYFLNVNLIILGTKDPDMLCVWALSKSGIRLRG